MDFLDIATKGLEFVGGASVLSLTVAKMFPKLRKFGPFLTALSKVLGMLALNHKPRDQGPAKPAVRKVRVLRDSKTGKVIGFRGDDR